MRSALHAEWSGKRVAVVGLGVSNLALIRFLKDVGAQISGRDQKIPEQMGDGFEELNSLGIDLVLGPHYLEGLEQYDVVVVSPGVPKRLPQLEQIKRLGRLESEIGLVFRYSKAPIYGITGSSGKTTTTSLVGEMLRASGIPVNVGGNIGTPLISVIEHLEPNDHVLLELSSFQLEELKQSPKGSLITNIAENHLDVHLTMENYIDAKKKIYRYQGEEDFVVLNFDDPHTRDMAKEAPGRVYYFSLNTAVNAGAYLDGDKLIYVNGGEKVTFAKLSDLALPGLHNVANFLAATVLSRELGASWEAISHVASNFTGVSHRLEFVAEVDGVRYYNDSIATTPQRTLAALQSFSEPIILIAGGSDKELSFADLASAIHDRVKHLVLLGATAPKIHQAVLEVGDFPVEVVDNLEQAVRAARSLAQDGDLVLLSPACASYDQYANFMERGHHFRTLVHDVNKSQ
ncbi:MAG: UDP-N-acetylmuramoyl-L-alanine--D-glutamate ligase [Firmicutes bacterium]|nr:UDP-N-acetylmuramoyl-L-alanine--D-glutamate ligase [Bacillota bacterium]